MKANLCLGEDKDHGQQKSSSELDTCFLTLVHYTTVHQARPSSMLVLCVQLGRGGSSKGDV